MRITHVLIIILLAAGLGLAVFGLMVRRAVTVEDVTPPEALLRFEEVRGAFGSADPLVRLDPEGRPVRDPATAVEGAPKPRHLRVLVYRLDEESLARAEVPFWFFKLKGPAVQLILRETEFDLKRLGITAGELERHGPRLVFDETRADGDRVLVWTD